jgi:hypothetical protein
LETKTAVIRYVSCSRQSIMLHMFLITTSVRNKESVGFRRRASHRHGAALRTRHVHGRTYSAFPERKLYPISFVSCIKHCSRPNKRVVPPFFPVVVKGDFKDDLGLITINHLRALASTDLSRLQFVFVIFFW